MSDKEQMIAEFEPLGHALSRVTYALTAAIEELYRNRETWATKDIVKSASYINKLATEREEAKAAVYEFVDSRRRRS